MFRHGGSFYISVDLEGIAAVIGEYGKGLGFDTPGYAFACKQAVCEINAAVNALYDAGATKVWVWDCHGKGYNFDYNALDERVKIVMGAGSGKRFPGIESGFDGVLFIGYHAYDTQEAVLAHVYSSSTYQYYKINGAAVGEMQIDASVAGEYGTPVVFASSDNICVAQAKASFGDIPTVITKTALAWNSCISEHPKRVCEEIYRKALQAAEAARGEKFAPFTFGKPFECEIRFKRIEYAESCRLTSLDGTRFERIDAYTVKGKVNSASELF